MTLHSIDLSSMDSFSKLGRSKTPPPLRSVQFLLGNEVKKYDSVDSLMDRIDDELGRLQVC